MPHLILMTTLGDGVYPYIKHDKTVVSKVIILPKVLDAEWTESAFESKTLLENLCFQLIICPQGKWYSSQGMGSQIWIFY